MEENKNTTAKKFFENTDGYKEGAIAGGLVGLCIAAYMRKNIMFGAIIGMIGGGYIGYISKKTDNQTKFTKPKN
jgi:uncharacterized protein YcfJ